MFVENDCDEDGEIEVKEFSRFLREIMRWG